MHDLLEKLVAPLSCVLFLERLVELLVSVHHFQFGFLVQGKVEHYLVLFPLVLFEREILDADVIQNLLENL